MIGEMQFPLQTDHSAHSMWSAQRVNYSYPNHSWRYKPSRL